MKRFEYDTVLHEIPANGGAYVAFPWDIRAEFDGVTYDGSIVNMGVKNDDETICYILGVLKAIRKKLDKHDGDTIHVVIEAE